MSVWPAAWKSRSRRRRLRRGGLPWPRLKYLLGGPAWILPVVGLALLVGCSDPDVLQSPTATSSHEAHDENLFALAMANLNRQYEFGPRQILPQIVERLNQWVTNEKPQVTWQLDPLTSTLPEAIRQSDQFKRLPESSYDATDGRFLREAVWMRDISNAVCAGEFDDREKADRLFDWTVCNLQLEPDDSLQPRAPLRPWEALLLGRGTAVERAWVFILLARQQHVDVVLLAIPSHEAEGAWSTWVPAALIEGQLVLYDMRLGLALPGPGGRGAATLQQAATDPAVLKQLDVPGRPYGVHAADLKQVLVLVEADSGYLSRRMTLVEKWMKSVEKRFVDDRNIVLSVAATPLAQRLEKCGHVRQVRIWTWPFEVEAARAAEDPNVEMALVRQLAPFEMGLHQAREVRVDEDEDQTDKPDKEDDQRVIVREQTFYPLWSGRLKHFEGQFDQAASQPATDDEDKNAKSLYLLARGALDSIGGQPISPEIRDAFGQIRELATYWLGCVSFQQGSYPNAAEYFQRTLNTWPKGRWKAGAKYNLARAFEENGQWDKALSLFEDPQVDMPDGSKLRAKWLRTSPQSIRPPLGALKDRAAVKPTAASPPAPTKDHDARPSAKPSGSDKKSDSDKK